MRGVFPGFWAAMPVTAAAVFKSMAARLAAAMTLLVIVVLLAVSISTMQALRRADDKAALDAVTVLSRTYARELRTRLAAGELVVQNLVSDDAGFGGAALRASILRSEIVRGVMLANFGTVSGPVPIDHDDSLALKAGHTLLRAGPRTAAGSALYLVHSVRVGGIPVIAFFELAPDWLWRDHEDAAAEAPAVLAVIDQDGTLLSASGPVPAGLLAFYA